MPAWYVLDRLRDHALMRGKLTTINRLSLRLQSSARPLRRLNLWHHRHRSRRLKRRLSGLGSGRRDDVIPTFGARARHSRHVRGDSEPRLAMATGKLDDVGVHGRGTKNISQFL